MKLNTIDKRIQTNSEGVFYKEIIKTTIDEAGRKKIKNDFDRVYIVRYKDEAGKHRTVRIGKKSDGITEAYCKRKRAEFVTLANNGELPVQIKRREKIEVVTLDMLAKVYFDDKAGTNSDTRQEGKYNNYIRERFGRKDLAGITKQDFKEFQRELDKSGKAKRTVNGILSLAKAIINHSIKEYDLNIDNPVNGVKPHKVDTIRRERYLSVEEVKKLIDAVKTDNDLYHFVQLALNTGGRFKTIMAIQKKDINFDNGHITLNDLKSDTTYTGFIDDKYLPELKEKVSDMALKDFVIPVPVRTLQRRLKKVLDVLFNEGLSERDFKDRVVAHTLRHTFASQLVLNGVAIYTVKTLMNHAKIEMTERYAKLAPSAGAAAVRGLYE